MRFPTRLLAANVYFAAVVWAAYLVFVALVVAAVAAFRDITRSGWEIATQVPLWFAVFAGVALVREFMPLYVANGQTRRRFGADAAVTVLLFAPVLSAFMVVGYLLEAGAYRLLGWPQTLGEDHLYPSPTHVPLVFAEHLVEFVACLVIGTFIGAGFYRWGAGGILTIPVGVALVVCAQGSIGAGVHLPFTGTPLTLDLPESLGLALAVCAAVFAVGWALTWAVLRDIPLRNKLS